MDSNDEPPEETTTNDDAPPPEPVVAEEPGPDFEAMLGSYRELFLHVVI
jgi:hypothetical protein